MSHYLPAYHDRPNRWGRVPAVCGAHIVTTEHSTDPTCPRCAAWLQDDESGFRTLQGLSAADFPPKPEPQGFQK